MSHLPIKPVDHYLDKISNKHVLFVGGIAIILIILFGPTISNILYARGPAGAPAPGQVSDHYPDNVVRTATTPENDSLFPRLYGTHPYVIPPYQTELYNASLY
jgi:hypothetical protein